ncbi:uncharacterized protein [Parasteatoda tepidariorum]|uniref:uncharacterized protein isoform X1 n=1 Tax=Parasteatoda tepidariorum TaxID=114398 RepID=UPI0039BD09F6
MYQAWQWGGTPATNPAAAGYVQTPATGQIAPPQWPSGYNQYAAMSPDVQQQWAAWQQYAYTNTVPVGQVPTTANFTTTYPEYQTAKDSQPQTATPASTTTPSENQTSSAEEFLAGHCLKVSKTWQLFCH